MSRGSRNLLILGISSVVIALATSSISLLIYYKSGDIYLDCSLPESDCPSTRSDSEENNRENSYSFPDSGKIDEQTLTEYLNEIQTPITMIQKLGTPFDDDSLSDEALGI